MWKQYVPLPDACFVIGLCALSANKRRLRFQLPVASGDEVCTQEDLLQNQINPPNYGVCSENSFATDFIHRAVFLCRLGSHLYSLN